MLRTQRGVAPRGEGCHESSAKQRQWVMTPVRMADVHTTRQGGTRGHGTDRDWIVNPVFSDMGEAEPRPL